MRTAPMSDVARSWLDFRFIVFSLEKLGSLYQSYRVYNRKSSVHHRGWESRRHGFGGFGFCGFVGLGRFAFGTCDGGGGGGEAGLLGTVLGFDFFAPSSAFFWVASTAFPTTTVVTIAVAPSSGLTPTSPPDVVPGSCAPSIAASAAVLRASFVLLSASSFFSSAFLPSPCMAAAYSSRRALLASLASLNPSSTVFVKWW